MPAYNTYKSTMKKNTFLILSLLLLYLYPLSASVEIRSNKLTTGDGLANNSTRYMMQESIEEMMAHAMSLEGVVRFDILAA